MSAPLAALDRRPTPGEPRDYHFPAFERSELANGLRVVRAHVPGRPLLQAQLLVRAAGGGSATGEAAELAGATWLMARAMSEGTQRRDAVAFTEAAERLGASLGAEAGWDSLGAHVEVPRRRLAEALALMAELTLEPSFPEHEVERLRKQRLNDLRQAMADPRRRVDRAFPAAIYAPGAEYGRPLAGTEATVPRLERDVLVARQGQLIRPTDSTLIVCGDLRDLDVDGAIESAFGAWASGSEASPEDMAVAVDAPAEGRRVLVVDRPGAPQSEVRVGHVGSPRRIGDFHALSVMNALLGGLFNSRLNRLLREERGYTYGVHSGFDLRLGAGPFAVRCAVESDVTAPAIEDILAELRRIREAPVETAELDVARDYLIGVFPLRFETSAQVAGALAGLVTYDLPDDELSRYRPTIAAVSAEDVHTAATGHIDPDAASVVIVGDASRFAGRLEELLGVAPEIVVDEGFEAGDADEAGAAGG